MILQPVKSDRNFAAKAGHSLKSPWVWCITFIYWCCVFSSVKTSAALHHKVWKTANVSIHQSLLCFTLSVAGKRALEIKVSCDVRTVSCLRLLCTKKTLTDCRESLGWSQAGAREVWEEVERAGLLQPGEERTERDLLGLYTYLIEDYREDGASLFVISEHWEQEGHKLHQGEFQPYARKKIFTVRTVICWQRLPRDAEVSPSLETLPQVLQPALCWAWGRTVDLAVLQV